MYCYHLFVSTRITNVQNTRCSLLKCKIDFVLIGRHQWYSVFTAEQKYIEIKILLKNDIELNFIVLEYRYIIIGY